MMSGLLDLFDVTVPLQVITWWAKKQRGYAARSAFFGFTVCMAVFGWLAWYFDMETTLEWAQRIHSQVLRTLAESALVYAPMILMIITVFPTVIRQTLSRASKERMMVAALLIFCLALFDIRTDWPRVRDFCAALYDLFDVFGPLQYIVWWIFRIFWLFMATDGFQILFVVCTAGAILCGFNGFKKAGRDDDD